MAKEYTLRAETINDIIDLIPKNRIERFLEELPVFIEYARKHRTPDNEHTEVVWTDDNLENMTIEKA